MNCDQIQPSLLDYGRKLLSRSEQEQIKAHLEQCTECAAALREEMELFRRLSGTAEKDPRNDVWALVRSRTQRKRPVSQVLVDGVASAGFRWIASSAAVIALVTIGIYSLAVRDIPQTKVPTEQANVIVAVYSDDPIAGHTDAVIDSIDNM